MYTEYPAGEAAKWAQAVDMEARKLRGLITGAKTQAAAAGYANMPGPAQAEVTEATITTKIALTQVNGKLYAEGVAVNEKADEVDEKVAFGFARLDMEAYRARLDNALDVQRAQDDHDVQVERARVDRLRSEIDLAQVAMIEEKADIEHAVSLWKLASIAAEDDALTAEVELANERLRTAQAKFEIIDYLQQVIEAEQLVLVAEKKRAGYLEALVAAEKLVIEAKKGLIPLHKQKSTARTDQAAAVKAEAGWREAIEKLGYERIKVKRSEDEATHQINQAEKSFEDARLSYLRAERTTEVLKASLRSIVMAYQNIVRGKVIDSRIATDTSERLFRISYQSLLRQFEINSDVTNLDVLLALAMAEGSQRVSLISSTSASKCHDIRRTEKREVHRRQKDDITQMVDTSPFKPSF